MPATKKKGTPAKKRSSGKKGRASYVRLRTALDALEMAAVRYYAEGRSATDRKKRWAELEKLLAPVITQLAAPAAARYPAALGADSGGDSEGSCPDGYVNCNGVCVPYPCPD